MVIERDWNTLEESIEVEDLNRAALRLAREVANKTGKIMAGGVSNTPLYKENDEEMANKITEMFRVNTYMTLWFLKVVIGFYISSCI